jgi:transmembrane sensor
MRSQNKNDRILSRKIKKELADHEFGSMEENWGKMREKLTKQDTSKVHGIPVFPRRRNFLYVGIAASILLILGLTLFYRMGNSIKWNKVYTGTNSIKKICLTDGTVIWINHDTQIEYPSHFKKDERIVHLSGEAYFEVSHDAARPFRVLTPYAEIKVLGTAFNVSAYPEALNEKVTVKSGVVSVRNTTGRKAETDTLYTGETNVISRGDTLVKKEINQDPNYLAWQSKRIEFKDTPLPDVARTLEAIYRKKIILESSGLDSLGLNATFEDVDFEVILRTIVLTLNVEITQRNDSVLISSVK